MQRRSMLKAGLAAVAATTLPFAPAAAATRVPARSLVVEAVQMPAWVDDGGERRPLGPGDTVSTGQPLETGGDAAVLLLLPEGSAVRLGEKTKLTVQRLEVESEMGTITVRSRVNLADGFLRFTTSPLSQALGRREVEVTLRTATIGIRGTDFWTMTDAVHDAACLFEGKVQLDTRDQGALVLDQPTAFWARFFDKPVQPVGNATPAELARFLRSTEPQPGRGMAIAGGRWRVVAAAVREPGAASAVASRLRQAGYPARVKAARGLQEVRIDHLVSRVDAQAVLDKIASIEGVKGRVALSA